MLPAEYPCTCLSAPFDEPCEGCTRNAAIEAIIRAGGFLYRPQRGGYGESMNEVRAFATRDELEAHLGAAITSISRYALDVRNGWDTHLVTTVNGPTGFTDRPPSEGR